MQTVWEAKGVQNYIYELRLTSNNYLFLVSFCKTTLFSFRIIVIMKTN